MGGGVKKVYLKSNMESRAYYVQVCKEFHLLKKSCVVEAAGSFVYSFNER